MFVIRLTRLNYLTCFSVQLPSDFCLVIYQNEPLCVVLWLLLLFKIQRIFKWYPFPNKAYLSAVCLRSYYYYLSSESGLFCHRQRRQRLRRQRRYKFVERSISTDKYYFIWFSNKRNEPLNFVRERVKEV